MSCRFFNDEVHIDNDPRKVRLLEIKCHNGFVGRIFVTKELAFVLEYPENRINVWHYDQSEDGKRITLKAKGSDSVKSIVNGVDACHETVTDWPLEEHE